MARPKKTTAKKTPSKRATTRKANSKKATPKKTTAKRTTAKAQTKDAIVKMLQGTPSTKRPPNNPDMPQNIIDSLNHDLNAMKDLLDSFSQHLRALDRCRKAKGFSARSLRYAQTPHFIRGVLPKAKLQLSGVAG
jgi:hypothetical protein